MANYPKWSKLNKNPKYITETEHVCTKSERKVEDKLKEEGFLVLRSGWPDFLAYNPDTGKVRLIESKTKHDKISKNQARMFYALQQLLHISVEVIESD